MNRPSELSVSYNAVTDMSDTPLPVTKTVSWAAIFAGAAAAAALSLILLMLGAGLGLSAISPWVSNGISAATFGVSTILWITFTQIFASGLGGYLAGRMRETWAEVHTDEVYFRDTVHGFLTWAVASIASASLLTSTIGTLISYRVTEDAAIPSATAIINATTSDGGQSAAEITKIETATTAYFVDSLFRKDPSVTPTTGYSANAMAQSTNAATVEVTRIFMNTIRTGLMPVDDSRYVGQIVAHHTGLSLQQAEKRVDETYSHLQARFNATEATVRDAADKARKASAYATLWLFISLLIGAFVASLAATYGGRQRDR